MAANRLQRLAGIAHQLDPAFDLDAGIADKLLDLLGGLCRALGQLAHLLGNDRKAFAGLARPRRFDTGIERQEVGLKGDLVDNADDVGDLAGGAFDPAHRFHGTRHHDAGFGSA